MISYPVIVSFNGGAARLPALSAKSSAKLLSPMFLMGERASSCIRDNILVRDNQLCLIHLFSMLHYCPGEPLRGAGDQEAELGAGRGRAVSPAAVRAGAGLGSGEAGGGRTAAARGRPPPSRDGGRLRGRGGGGG